MFPTQSQDRRVSVDDRAAIGATTRTDITQRAQRQVVQSLMRAAAYRDNETGKHTLRISRYAGCVAKAAGYSQEAARRLMLAVPLHDIGKIGIPDAILHKPGQLTASEMAIMRQHTVIGAAIIGNHGGELLRTAYAIALHHHERWDGGGYPSGLVGEDIPPAARITSLVDVFDALVSRRPYKEPWPIERALDFIRQESGTRFDPALVETFVRCLPKILKIRDRWGI